jgi:hypothetical protein
MELINHYIIFPAAWLTDRLLDALVEDRPGNQPQPIFDENDVPTKYYIAKIKKIYKNEYEGFRKLTLDQTKFVIASILDDTVEVSDYYQAKG